jgi:hypothetical protein
MAKRKAKRTRAKTRVKRKARPARAARTRSRARRRPAPKRRAPARAGGEDQGRTVALLRDVIEHHETGPGSSAGDLDADWRRAQSSGEEAVGGSVPTPDQDVVDEIGHALGVEQASTAPVRTAEEILGDRDRRYWELERRAARKATKRREP